MPVSLGIESIPEAWDFSARYGMVRSEIWADFSCPITRARLQTRILAQEE
jgi:hypothetical protein